MGILQARILEWIAISSPWDLPDPGIEPGSPTLQADSLSSEPLGKHHDNLLLGDIFALLGHQSVYKENTIY